MISEILTPFSLPIYKSHILNEDLSQLQDIIKGYITNNVNDFKIHWGCPTLSNINSKNNTLQNLPLLNNILKPSIQKYYEEWGFDPSSLILEKVWVNISPPHAYQEVHQHLNYHKKNLFSGVLYIEVNPNSGDLILLNPLSTQMHSMLMSSKIKLNLKIPPQNGVLVLFPSWMEHYVESNLSNQNRISISFNISIK